MLKIHPTAIIDPQVEVGEDVEIGPYVVIEGKVSLGNGTVVLAHSWIHGAVIIGQNCRIGPGAYVGVDPQHLGYKGEETWLQIGDGCIIREAAQVSRAFKPGKENAAILGNRCFLMSAAHVGHDCHLGDDVVLATGVALGGHVEAGDKVFFGGGCVIHQFVRVGRLAMIGGNEATRKDVLPFAMVKWEQLKGYNVIGCRRAGLSRPAIAAIKGAFIRFSRHLAVPAAVAAIEQELQQLPEVKEMVDFANASQRGLLRSRRSAIKPQDSGDDEQED